MKHPVSYRPQLGINLTIYVWIMLVIGLAVVFSPSVVLAYPYNPVPSQPGFENGLRLPGAHVAYSSPVAADLDKDGKKEIIVGGTDGRCMQFAPTGR